MRPFWSDQRANVAVLFGLLLVPLVSVVGMAVDYSRAINARTAMQAALDSAALMISKDSSSLTPSEIAPRAQAYFNAMLKRPDLANISVTASYTASTGSGSKIEMSASGRMATDFMKVVGFPNMDLNVKSTTMWGNTRIRVALALDVTGSMASDGKMPAMKAAAKKLIDQLSANAKSPEDLYISMIPFSTHINVGASKYQQTWLDWNDWEETNGDCSGGGDKSRTKCLSKGNVWTPNNHSKWNGCITDREEEYDVKKTPPVTVNVATLFQPDQFSPCPVELVPLSYDWAKIKASIDQLSPGGPTNQPVGMAWGWLSLMPTLPLNAPPEDSSFVYKKILIVLSDGLNTKNKKSGNGFEHALYVDGRQKLLCDNIKADGITVYTIQVNTDGDPTSTILQYCASSSDKFFMLTSPSQLMSAFDTIGGSLAKLRIAK
jgi:Flp pilus assembly protein TadG